MACTEESEVRLYDYDAAAAYLHTTPRMVRRLRQERRLGSVKVGRHVRFTRENLETFIARHELKAVR